MIVLVTGTRHATGPNHRLTIRYALHRYFGREVTIRHGAAPGADTITADIAADLGWATDPHPADWASCGPLCPGRPHRRTRRVRGGGSETYCPLAGHWRNQRMVDGPPKPDAFLAFPAVSSAGEGGTWDCIFRAVDAGIQGQVHPLHVPNLLRYGPLHRGMKHLRELDRHLTEPTLPGVTDVDA